MEVYLTCVRFLLKIIQVQALLSGMFFFGFLSGELISCLDCIWLNFCHILVLPRAFFF
jgi:hypothetical protein